MKTTYEVSHSINGGVSATAKFSNQKDAFHFISDLISSGREVITLKVKREVV